MFSFKYPIMLVFAVFVILGGAQVPMDIYLLAGQSNMSGRGGVTNITATTWVWDGVIPPESQPNPAILRFTVNQTWEEAREPLHSGIDPKIPLGVGPGFPFANALLRWSNASSVGIVPCAIGGSALNEWQKGQPHYVALIDRARKSTAGGGVIKGLLWYQGETDSYYHNLSQTYAERFETFVRDVRTDLSYPTLPIITVALASGFRYKCEVREAQLGIRLPSVSCVDALGLQLEPDTIHLTTPSQVVLGEKMAREFLAHF